MEKNVIEKNIESMGDVEGVVSTISEAAYIKLKDNMQALNSAFAVHVKQTESELDEIKSKQQESAIESQEEKKMEQKRLSDTTDVNINTRISQLENAVRNAFEVKSSSIEDVKMAKLSALGLYLKTGQLESKSNVGKQDTLDGGVVLHESLSHALLRDIWNSPLLNNATTIAINGKTLKIHSKSDRAPREYARWSLDGYNPKNDSIMPEKNNVSDITANTCFASAIVSHEFMEDLNETAVQAWIQSEVIESFKGQIDYAILFGTADKSVEGIFTYDGLNNGKIKHAELDGNKLLEGLLTMVSTLNVRYVNKSAWYMSPEFLTAIMKSLLDSKTTQFIEMLKMSVDKDNQHSYTLFGKPVYLIPDMPADHPVMLANMSAGYYLVQHDGTYIKRISDYELDAVKYGYRIRIGGKVVNPDAFVLADTTRAA